MDDLAVYAAVAKVLDELPAIGKDGRAPANMGGYSFRSVEDITAALKPLLARHELMIVPSILERRDSERQTSGSKVMFVTDLHVQFDFVASDGSRFHATMWGQGTDMGDKACQKAVTAAFKSMLSVTFCISDRENDAEAHDVPTTERRPKPASKERIDVLKGQVTASLGLSTWVKDQGFAWPWTDAACDAIEAKLEEPM